MSDVSEATAGQPPGLTQMIMEVDEPTWKRIAKALKVETRQEAVQLVQQDEDAADIVSQILSSKSALTEEAGEMPETALTSAPKRKPIEERVYGGKARLQIG